jgi:hypothetical protein
MRSAFISLLCLIAIYSVMHLSYADLLAHSSSPNDLNRAVYLAPFRADYLLRRARLNGPTAKLDLELAAQLDPRNAEPWIDLGLLEEARRDFPAAEFAFLAAQKRDASYYPRWTLANYYLRRNNADRFWQWASSAASILDGNPAALFRLCLRAASDPAEVRQRVVPNHPSSRRKYLEVVLADRVFGEVLPAARSLGEYKLPQDRALLLTAVSTLTQNNMIPSAVELWNELIDAHYLPHRRLNPSTGISLTNANWAEPRSQAAFDWQSPVVDGVETTAGISGGLTLAFNGRPLSEEILLRQRMPLLAGARYVLSYRYASAADPSNAACQWRIGGQHSRPMDSTNSTNADFEFKAPPEPLAQLDLILQRRPGTTWPSGKLNLEKVELRLAPQP